MAIEITYAPSDSGRQPRGRAERVEHLAHVGRRGEIRRDERPAALQLAQQERLAVGLAPFLVRAEPQLARDGRQRLRVPRGVLPQIEAHQRARRTPPRAAAGRSSRPPASTLSPISTSERWHRRERLREVLRALDDGHGRDRRARQPRLDRPQRCRQPRAQVAQQLAVRLVGVADARAQLVAGIAHRQLVAQRVHLAQVQAGRLPARQLADRLGHARGHRGVAVAIAANPRPEAQRRRVQRQPAPGVLDERRVEHAQEARQRVPERLLEDDQPGPRLVDGRGPLAPHLARLPRRGNLDAQRVEQIARLGQREIGPVAQREQVRDAPVLLHQRAARDLGRMRREHQLDLQPDDHGVQRVGGDAGAAQASERLVARADLGRRLRIALVEAAAADPVVLLGDVRQRQEVRERARDRQRLVDRHPLEDAGQRVEIGIVAAAGALRQRADALDRFVQRVVLLPPQRFAQQLAEQPDVVSQGFREIFGHGRSVLRREGGPSALGGRRAGPGSRLAGRRSGEPGQVAAVVGTGPSRSTCRRAPSAQQPRPRHCDNAAVPRLITALAPVRICDCGGWTDTWFAGHGQVFSIAVSPYVEVQIAAAPAADGRHDVSSCTRRTSGAVRAGGAAAVDGASADRGDGGARRRAATTPPSRSRSTPTCPRAPRPARARRSPWPSSLRSSISAGGAVDPATLARAAHAVEAERLGRRVGHPGSDWRSARRRELHRDARVPRGGRVAGGAGRRDVVGARLSGCSSCISAARTTRPTCTARVIAALESDRGRASQRARAGCAMRPPQRGTRPRPVISPRSGRAMCENTAAQAALHPDLVSDGRARGDRAGPLARRLGLEGERRRRRRRLADPAGRTCSGGAPAARRRPQRGGRGVAASSRHASRGKASACGRTRARDRAYLTNAL